MDGMALELWLLWTESRLEAFTLPCRTESISVEFANCRTCCFVCECDENNDGLMNDLGYRRDV